MISYKLKIEMRQPAGLTSWEIIVLKSYIELWAGGGWAVDTAKVL